MSQLAVHNAMSNGDKVRTGSMLLHDLHRHCIICSPLDVIVAEAVVRIPEPVERVVTPGWQQQQHLRYCVADIPMVL